MNALIVDDEIKSRNTLNNFLVKYCPELKVLGQADGVQTGLEQIEALQPDLIFLDIEMGDGTGFDLLEKLQNKSLKVIFVTAYNEYAIQAFRFSAVDYLLKPINPEELIAAVRKLNNDTAEQKPEQYKTLLSNHKKIRKIALPTQEGIEFIPIEKIIRCEADNNYTRFHLLNSKSLLVSKTLKEFQELLESQGFFRVHQSHLVHLNYVQKYMKGSGGVLVMEDGSHVDVARRKKEALLEVLSQYF